MTVTYFGAYEHVFFCVTVIHFVTPEIAFQSPSKKNCDAFTDPSMCTLFMWIFWASGGRPLVCTLFHKGVENHHPATFGC